MLKKVMALKSLLAYVWKLPLCGLGFFAGMVGGGMVATFLGLHAPPMPEGAGQTEVIKYLLLGSPVLALALALVARGIGGPFLARTLTLSFLTWIAYSVNTVLEASIFTNYASASWFTVVTFLGASLVCGTAVAWLFPSAEMGKGIVTPWKEFYGRRPRRAWIWRMMGACFAFMPIYLFFGRLVVPITGEYFRQSMVGLTAPGWGQILPVLLVRSLLFLLASLPVLAMWQKSNRSLVVSLGFALFVLVGLLYMLEAYWMPAIVRVTHSLEISADSFVYALVLVTLAAKKRTV